MTYTEDFKACSAQALIENRTHIREREKQKREEFVSDTVEAATRSVLPVIEEMRAVVNELKVQNQILQKQAEEAELAAKSAMQEAKKANIHSWVSFIIATLISLMSLIVAIVK